MKFLVDMPVTPQAVPHLEGKGHEAVHITDLGSEFTGKVFHRSAARLGIGQRFASRENLCARRPGRPRSSLSLALSLNLDA